MEIIKELLLIKLTKRNIMNTAGISALVSLSKHSFLKKIVSFSIYCYFKGKSIEFHYNNTKKNKHLRKFIENFVPKFSPTFYLPSPFNKLMISLFSSKRFLKEYRREIFKFSDGGQIPLEFYPKSVKHPKESENCKELSLN